MTWVENEITAMKTASSKRPTEEITYYVATICWKVMTKIRCHSMQSSGFFCK